MHIKTYLRYRLHEISQESAFYCIEEKSTNHLARSRFYSDRTYLKVGGYISKTVNIILMEILKILLILFHFYLVLCMFNIPGFKCLGSI